MINRMREQAFVTVQQHIIAQHGENDAAYIAVRETFELIRQARTARELTQIVQTTTGSK